MNNASASVHPSPQANFDIEAQQPETVPQQARCSSEKMKKVAHIVGSAFVYAAVAGGMWAGGAALSHSGKALFIGATLTGSIMGACLGGATGYNETHPRTSQNREQ